MEILTKLASLTDEDESMVVEDDRQPETPQSRVFARIWAGWSKSLFIDHIGLNDGPEYRAAEEAAIWQRVGDTLNEVNVDKAVEKVIAEIKEEFEAGTLSEEQAERRREHARQVGLEKALELTGKSATNDVARPDPVYLTEEEAVIKKRIQASWARIEVDRRLDTAISEIGEGVEAGLIQEMQAEGHREYAHQLGEMLFLELAGTESEPTGSAR